MDMGGTHAAETGTVNFAAGAVNNRGSHTTLVELFRAAGKDEAYINANFTADGIFKDFSNHTMNFFNMGRGGFISYCSLRFNMPIVEENSVAVSKEVVLGEQAAADLGDVDIVTDITFNYQLRTGADEASLAPAANVDYQLYTSATGDLIGTGPPMRRASLP